MIDKNMIHIDVAMVKINTIDYPKYYLPEGYSFCNYEESLEDEWIKLQVSVDHIDNEEEAKKIFKDVFLKFPNELEKKCVFIKDENGNIAGTASLWRGEHFGQVLQRVHWVAVSPNYQGKGLAKALISKVLDVYNDLGHKDFIYLTTQTWSYKAVKIYLDFGFEPYKGKKPVNWSGSCKEFDNKNLVAWDLIMDKITNRK